MFLLQLEDEGFSSIASMYGNSLPFHPIEPVFNKRIAALEKADTLKFCSTDPCEY